MACPGYTTRGRCSSCDGAGLVGHENGEGVAWYSYCYCARGRRMEQEDLETRVRQLENQPHECFEPQGTITFRSER